MTGSDAATQEGRGTKAAADALYTRPNKAAASSQSGAEAARMLAA